jgi:hypothetical protein
MARVACVSALDTKGLHTNVPEAAAGITTIVTGEKLNVSPVT